MLKNEELRTEIIQLHHNILIVGHKGRQKMTELVIRNYWQPEVIKEVGKYIDSCDMYQRMNNHTKVPAGKLKLSEVPEKLQTYLIVDFIMKLPLVARKNAILVVYNRLSKIIHFVITTEGMLAKDLVQLFRDNIWKLHGLLKSVILDRRLQFAVELTKELNKMLGIETKLSILFYPQNDGQTEIMNQEPEQYLQFFIDYRQKNQLEWLATAEFAVNNKTHSATKVSVRATGQKSKALQISRKS